MSWLTEIATSFTVLKECLAIGQEIWAFLQQEEDSSARKQLAKNLTTATQLASQTGDTSALENIFKSANSAPDVSLPKS